MDWTLSDLCTQATLESSYQMGLGWQCDFYFGYGHDVIEEEALNEKLCVQVLKMLITKADNEIAELEDDIVMLQSQIAWADDEWSELYSAALREKIDCLDISICSLKEESDDHGSLDCLQIHRGPAERLQDIAKDLLRNNFQEKDKQSVDCIAKELSSGHSGHATCLLMEQKRLNNSTASSIIEEEIEKPITTLTESTVASEIVLKAPREQVDFPGTAKNEHHREIVKNASLKAKNPVSGPSKEKCKLSSPGSECNWEKSMENSSASTAPTLDLSLRLEERTETDIEDEEKPTTAEVKDSSSHHAIGHSVEKRLSTADSRIIKEEIREQSPSIIMGSSMQTQKKECKFSETVKDLQNERHLKVVQKSSLAAMKPASGFSKKASKLKIPDLKRKEKIITKDSTASPAMLDLSLRPEEGRSDIEDKEKVQNKPSFILTTAGVKDTSKRHAPVCHVEEKMDSIDSKVISEEVIEENPSIFRESSLGSKKKGSTFSEKAQSGNTRLYSGSGDLKKASKSSNSKRKLKQGVEAASGEIDTSASSLTKGKKTETTKNMKVLAHPDKMAAELLLKLLNHGRKGPTDGHPKEFREAGASATVEESSSKKSPKQLKKQLKRKHQLAQESVPEPCLSVELGLDSFIQAKYKRQQMRGKSLSCIRSANEEAEKKTNSDLFEHKESGFATGVRLNSVSLTPKRRKIQSSSQVTVETRELRGLEINVSTSHNDTTDIMTEENLSFTECRINDISDTEEVKSLKCPTLPSLTKLIVENLKVVDLKAIAKQHNLQGVYKFRKAELAEHLVMQIPEFDCRDEDGKEGASITVDNTR